MRRVLIVGSPGAGKSTLAREVGRRTGLPVIHLDQHYWRAGWVEPGKAEWSAQVAGLIAGERWVMDGNYGGTLEQRLERADTVIDLEMPVLLCLFRVLRRTISSYGRTRPDMAEGCPERVEPAFLWWIAKYPFTSRTRVERVLTGFRGQTIKLCSAAQVRRFLAALGHSA